MKQTLTSLMLSLTMVLSLLIMVPQRAVAQSNILTLTCTGNATTDTAALVAAETSIGSVNLATFQIPFKPNILQRCKFNTNTITPNITVDNTNGSGIEPVAGQTLTLGRIVNPNKKQMFFGTGSVVVTSGGIISAHWFAGADIGVQINAASLAATGVPTEIQAFGGGTIAVYPVIQENHTLHLFPGTYMLNTAGGVPDVGADVGVIQLKDNAQLIGEGDNTIIVENSTPNCALYTCRYRMITTWATTQSPLNRLPSRNVKVSNLQLQGVVTNPHDGGVADAINFGNCTGCSATYILFSRVSGYSAQFGADPRLGYYAKGGVFSHNRMINLQSQNVAVITGENIEVSNNEFTDPGVRPVAITAASNTTPIQITTEPNNITTGNKVWIGGVRGNTAANSDEVNGLAWYATRIDSTHFTLTGTINANGVVVPGNVAGNGTYVTGTGFAVHQGPALAVVDFEANGYNHGEEKFRNSLIQNNRLDLRNITTTVYGIGYNPTTTGVPNEGAVISGNTILGRSVGVPVTNCTNASPIVCTADLNEYSDGDIVSITGVNGNTAANGVWRITYIDGLSFSLNNSQGNSAFTSSPGSITRKWAGGQALLGQGIYTSNYVTGAIIADNTIYNASGSGIAAAGDSIVISDNKIVDSGTGGSPAITLVNLTNSKVSHNKSSWRDDHENFIGESGTNTGNLISDNQVDVIKHMSGSTVTNSTYQNNYAVSGPTAIYGGILETTNSNNNTYINNTTNPPNGGTLYGLTLVGSTSTYIKHNFTNKAGTTYGVQPKFCFTGLACIYVGTGSPEGVQTAIVGSSYTNLSNGAQYAKTSGSGPTGWTLGAGGGFANPMTTNGDVITQVAGVPARVGIGTAGQVLTVSGGGLPVWSAAGSGSACGSTTEIQFNLAGVCGTDADFVFDYTNKRLGVGTAVPSSTISIDTNLSGTDGGLTIGQYNVTPRPSILLRAARGTGASPTAVQANDTLGRILADGYGTTIFGATNPTAILFNATAAFTDTSRPTYMTFFNTPVGSTTRAENMRISTEGVDVAAHAAMGATASIDQVVGSSTGPTLLNVRETLSAFGVTDAKSHGILSYYTLDPAGAQASNYESHGIQSILEVTNGNTQAFAGELDGLTGTTIYGGTNTLASGNAVWADFQWTGTGNATQIQGISARVRTANNGGTAAAAIAGAFQVANTANKIITAARGVTANISNTSTGTITSASTLQAGTPTNSGGGTISTLIQLDVRDPTGTCTTCYGAWIRGATLFNKFEGNVLLGDGTTPLGKLDLQGSVNFTAITAPIAITAGTPSAGGSCTAGTHSYAVTFTSVGSGETTSSTTSNVITCVNTTGQTVGLSGIPLGPIGTTGRKIYRKVAGNTGNYKLLATLSNNTTTVYSDTIADGSLGADAPSSNTTAVGNLATAGTTRMAISSTGLVGINQTAPAATLHVGGKILSDPQAFYSGTASPVGFANFHSYGNPDNSSQIAHFSARLTETLPNTADPSTFIGLYTSVDNTNGRGTLGTPVGLWGMDVVAQMLESGLGGAATYIRTAELEIGTNIDTIDDPFGPLSGGKGRANAVELLSIGGQAFRPTSYLGMWANDTTGDMWPKMGIYTSRAYSYGLVFQKRTDDAIDPFRTAMIWADSPTPYVMLGGARTFTNGIDLTASTVTTCAFCSPGFNVSGAGAVTAAFTTSPILLGGAGTTSTLQLRPTSGAGTTGADIIFQTGTNGSREVIRITNAGITNLYKGADVASATAIVPTGNSFAVTGTTNITSITATGITAGTTITLIFSGILDVVDGSNLNLAGNFTTSAGDTLTLIWDGSVWNEIARSVN